MFDQMASRTKVWNFAVNFGGIDLNKIWSRVVVVVVKFELICKNPECT
jgi:hypothetical protein